MDTYSEDLSLCLDSNQSANVTAMPLGICTIFFDAEIEVEFDNTSSFKLL